MRHLPLAAAALSLAPALVLISAAQDSPLGNVPLPLRSVGDEAYAAIAQFYDYDEQAPLDARIVERDETPDRIREKVVFTGVRDSRVPGYLGLPKTGAPPFPVVLEIDGLTGSKERFWQDDSWPRGGELTRALLSAGIAVFSMDAQYHGERAFANDFESPGGIVFGRRVRPNRHREMIVQTTVEHRRALDYLASRPEIDLDRVGALGHSMGGVITFALSAMERRVKASVACVTPLASQTAVAPQTFAPRLEAPFLMLMGRKDELYGAEEIRQLYALVRSRTKDLEVYDSGHRLPPEYVGRAVAWFRQHLTPSQERSE